jgi:hypothetical protein
MEVDWDLEDWLLDAGEQVTHKLIEHGLASLTPVERLVREFWLMDNQTRNGGVSQYFCNLGLEQWQSLREAWEAADVPGLWPIIAEIERLTASYDDPYLAALAASPAIEEFYELHQQQVKAELKRLVEATA